MGSLDDARRWVADLLPRLFTEVWHIAEPPGHLVRAEDLVVFVLVERTTPRIATTLRTEGEAYVELTTTVRVGMLPHVALGAVGELEADVALGDCFLLLQPCSSQPHLVNIALRRFTLPSINEGARLAEAITDVMTRARHLHRWGRPLDLSSV